jgi:REP element-mobilizing transposase RayT
MKFDFQNRYTELYFTTATVKDWKHLLKPEKYKKIITDSMAFLTTEGSVWIYAFVIMPNHFHWIWQMKGETQLPYVQQRMMKFVAQQIKFDLLDHHPLVLDQFKAARKDRQYQFFKEKPLSVALYTEEVVWQKIVYIHRNPVQQKWCLAKTPEDYVFSSAAFYNTKDTRWSFLTHFWYGDDWLAITE